MSVRSGLMALLAEGEKYGAQLRSEFEGRTGGTWPLNVGQVYTTLDRLVRDGLVEQAADPDGDGRIAYRLTDGGRAELTAWWSTPVATWSASRSKVSGCTGVARWATAARASSTPTTRAGCSRSPRDRA